MGLSLGFAVRLLRSRKWLVRSLQVVLSRLLVELFHVNNSFKGHDAVTRCLSPHCLPASGMLTLYRSIAAVVAILFPGPLVAQTSLGGGTSVAQGLFIEVFLTAQLVFTIFMLAAEKHKATFLAPVGIGLSLFIAQLTGLSS